MRVYDGPIVDTHAHLQLDEHMQFGDVAHRPAQYLAAARTSGYDVKAVGALVMAPPHDLPRVRQMNDLALELATDGPWYAMCSVHPYDGDEALTEVDRVAGVGARGLKLHPTTQDFEVLDERVIAVVKRAASHQLPVLFDAYSPFDAGQPGKLAKLALKCDEAKLIFAHMYGPRFLELMVYEIFQRYSWWTGQVWFDLSWAAAKWSGSPYAAQFEWVCRQMGVDRLLFGSDYPVDSLTTAIDGLGALGFNDVEMRRIAHDNACDLFGLHAKTSP